MAWQGSIPNCIPTDGRKSESGPRPALRRSRTYFRFCFGKCGFHGAGVILIRSLVLLYADIESQNRYNLLEHCLSFWLVWDFLFAGRRMFQHRETLQHAKTFTPRTRKRCSRPSPRIPCQLREFERRLQSGLAQKQSRRLKALQELKKRPNPAWHLCTLAFLILTPPTSKVRVFLPPAGLRGTTSVLWILLLPVQRGQPRVLVFKPSHSMRMHLQSACQWRVEKKRLMLSRGLQMHGRKSHQFGRLREFGETQEEGYGGGCQIIGRRSFQPPSIRWHLLGCRYVAWEDQPVYYWSCSSLWAFGEAPPESFLACGHPGRRAWFRDFGEYVHSHAHKLAAFC